MFGFSLQKLLVLAAVIAAVWYGFKLIGRLQEQRKADAELRASTGKRSGRSGHVEREAAPPDAEDMVECPVCQAYVPARSASNCGRADCPY